MTDTNMRGDTDTLDTRHVNATMGKDGQAICRCRTSRRWATRTPAGHAHAHAIATTLALIMSLAFMLPITPTESAYAHTTEGTDVPQACSYGMTQACGVDRVEGAVAIGATDDDGNTAYSNEHAGGRQTCQTCLDQTAQETAYDDTPDNAAITRQMAMDGQPTIRQVDDSGSGSYMTNLDLTNLAQKDNDTSDDSGGGSNFVQNALKAMQQIVNTVLLPISIVVVVARLMYIAVFPLMIGIDPFDVIDTDSFREGPQSVMRRTTRGGNGDGSKDPTFGAREYDWGGKGDWRVKLTQEQIEYIMKQELIGSGKVLLWIIVIWGVINLAIWLAGTVLGYFHI